MWSNEPGPCTKAQARLPVWGSCTQSGSRSGRLAAWQLGMGMQRCQARGCHGDLAPTCVFGVQEKALKLATLREVEPLVQKAAPGPKDSVLEACCAAVEQHLSEEPYSQQVRAATRATWYSWCPSVI